jgi:hypothetical protein
MKDLKTKQKEAVSYGLVAIIFLSGAMVSFVPLLTGQNNDQNVLPKTDMQTIEPNAPKMNVHPNDSSISKGIPVPGSNVPEMIVKPD